MLEIIRAVNKQNAKLIVFFMGNGSYCDNCIIKRSNHISTTSIPYFLKHLG